MVRKQKIMPLVMAIMMFITISVFLPGMSSAGNLEPSGPPGSTMKTLDEVNSWNQIIPGSERFELCMGGAAVLDKETGLVWEQSPDTTNRTWADACDYCPQKEVGGRLGWRLPTIEELASLVDRSVGSNPKLPADHPFSNVLGGGYWSSTTNVNNIDIVRDVHFGLGIVTKSASKSSNVLLVWCVRGGQGYDAY